MSRQRREFSDHPSSNLDCGDSRRRKGMTIWQGLNAFCRETRDEFLPRGIAPRMLCDRSGQRVSRPAHSAKLRGGFCRFEKVLARQHFMICRLHLYGLGAGDICKMCCMGCGYRRHRNQKHHGILNAVNPAKVKPTHSIALAARLRRELCSGRIT